MTSPAGTSTSRTSPTPSFIFHAHEREPDGSEPHRRHLDCSTLTNANLTGAVVPEDQAHDSAASLLHADQGEPDRERTSPTPSLVVFHAHRREPDGSEPHQRRLARIGHAYERESDRSGGDGTSFSGVQWLHGGPSSTPPRAIRRRTSAELDSVRTTSAAGTSTSRTSPTPTLSFHAHEREPDGSGGDRDQL